MHTQSAVTTFLFTDIEGSSRLWEAQPAAMGAALARHDAIARAVVEAHRGVLVKMTGDGLHAAFDAPGDAVAAALALQQAFADPATTSGLPLRVRCGVHLGAVERRDNDFFGAMVNRAARIMAAAHGGQVLLSDAVAAAVADRLPPGAGLRDLGAVRLRDLASPERVHQLLHPQLRREFPALRSLEATPNNLPQQVTSFVGRAQELADVKALLGRTRLLTLLGAGGLGKTRLSLQAAADVLDDYPDGVWLVELAPLTDPRLVPQAVAATLGVKEEQGATLVDSLRRHAAGRRSLLILDNCEHVIEAAALLATALLQSAPDLTIMASSREPLRVPGEATYPVPSLAVPDARAAATPEAVLPYAAVRLFVERATAVQPAFVLDAGNASAVAGICRRIDGIPLAIELAAARVRTLSVATLAERIGDRFRLLTGGNRTALPRQQTLRALIDWSYDLLSADERTLLARLSVFAGGWTLEDAEAVTAGGTLGADAVLDLLTGLVDKSLVASEAEGERYRLLDTVRQYAQERLDASGERRAVADRHLAHFLGVAEAARPELVGPRQGFWLARLDAMRENLIAAHAWCDHAGDGGERRLRLASAMRRYLMMRGMLELGWRIAVEALARPDAQVRGRARCRALADAGHLGSWMGRYADAQRYLEESLAIARELEDSEGVALVLQPLALAALGQGDHVAARACLTEALALEEAQGNRHGVAGVINALAQIHRAQGELDVAAPLYERVLTLARGLGDREIIAIGLLNLAMVSIGQGATERVAPMLLEVLAIAGEIGSKPAGQSVLEVCAGYAAWRGDWTQAARFFGAAEAHMAETGIHRDPADEAFLMPLIARARVALGEAAFGAAAAAGRAPGYDASIVEAHAVLSALAGRGTTP